MVKGSMHLSYVQDIMYVFSHEQFTSTSYQLLRLEMQAQDLSW